MQDIDEFLYLRIAKTFEKQIVKEVIRLGDKLPSLRSICRQYDVSQTTAMQAYYYLESKFLIESKPKSGYYVSYSSKHYPAIPEISKPGDEDNDQEDTEALIEKVYHNSRGSKPITLSLSVPAPELLPIAKLNKAMVNALRTLPASGTAYEHIQGNVKLRRQVARLSHHMEVSFTEDDLVITDGCMNAISYAMMTLTKPCDTIIVESPVYFGILQLAKSLLLKVLELPTHPKTGIELGAVKRALEEKKITLCLLVSNFSNPLGSCMPDEHKKEMVKLIQKHNVPLIEDDIYGDVYFGLNRPKTCKTFDESGLVFWCNSISKTLAPGYRVGWIAPGKYKDQVLKLKKYHSLSSPTLTQEVIGSFLENGRYEHHLRKLRSTLQANSINFLNAIHESFPAGVKVNRPDGGFVLWVELDKQINAVQLYEKAIKRNISIAPGSMFTLQKQFSNCMRLSYGMKWDYKVAESLNTLGMISKEMMGR